MKTVRLLLGLASGLLAVGCTFASPTTSTYNAGKSALSTGDGGTDDGGASSSSASASTSASGSGGGTQCCSQSGGKFGGTCIAKDAVPASDQSEVTADTCADGQLCVPTSQVENMPVKCGLAGGIFKGVCLGTCFSEYLSLSSVVLKSDDCSVDEVCVPCDAPGTSMLAGCSQ